MDKRTLIIIIALILPLLALLFMSQGGPRRDASPALTSHMQGQSSPMNRRPLPPATLEEAKARTKQRLADLDKMTEEEWQAQMRMRRGGGGGMGTMPPPQPRNLPPLEPGGIRDERAPASPPVGN